MPLKRASCFLLLCFLFHFSFISFCCHIFHSCIAVDVRWSSVEHKAIFVKISFSSCVALLLFVWTFGVCFLFLSERVSTKVSEKIPFHDSSTQKTSLSFTRLLITRKKFVDLFYFDLVLRSPSSRHVSFAFSLLKLPTLRISVWSSFCFLFFMSRQGIYSLRCNGRSKVLKDQHQRHNEGCSTTHSGLHTPSLLRNHIIK